MKIVICDDEQDQLDLTTGYVKQYEQESKSLFTIVPMRSGEAVLDYYDRNPDIDLLILDIIMDKIDGMVVAKELRKRGSRAKIIFLTSVKKYVFQGYRVNAVRYLLKPINYEQLKMDFEVILQDIHKDRQLFFYERYNDKVELVYFDDVIFVETFKKQTMVHTTNGEVLSQKNMKVHEKELKDPRFFRCHASYIVNFEYIKKIDSEKIYMKDNTMILCSRQKKKMFLTKFADYLGTLI